MRNEIIRNNDNSLFLTPHSSFLINKSLIPGLLFLLFVILSYAGQRSRTEPVLTVHYYRYDADYEGWNVWAWPAEPPGNGMGFAFDLDNPDADGFVTARIYFTGEYLRNVEEIGVIIRKSTENNEWAQKDGHADRFTRDKEIWLVQTDQEVYTEKPHIMEPPVFFSAAYNSDLDAYYYSGNDLGLRYSKRESIFKVWSPMADEVFVAL